MWEFFVWGAILGFSNNVNKEIESHQLPFRWSDINAKHQDLLLILAIQNYGNFDIVNDKEKLKAIIENYSNGGMQIIHEQIAKDRKCYNDMNSLINIIIERVSDKKINAKE